MDLTEDDVLEILNLIDQSEFDYFRLQSEELNLTVSKGGYIPRVLESEPVERHPAPANRQASEAPSPVAEASAPLPAETPVPDGLVAITAPMVGTFYRAPEPGADPFVDVGASIGVDTTVGLVEVMKVFTAIPAGVTGTVSEVVAANAAFVEKGAVLYLVTPDEKPSGAEAD